MQSINNRLEFPAQIKHPAVRNNDSSPVMSIKDFLEAFKDKKKSRRCEVIQDWRMKVRPRRLLIPPIIAVFPRSNKIVYMHKVAMEAKSIEDSQMVPC